jgi:hypothetical protein
MSGASTPSRWITTGVNGVLADSLVNDFGRAAMALNTDLIPPLDWRLCLIELTYGSAAAVDVTVFFAEAPAAAPENTVQFVNRTGTDAAQFFIYPAVTIPRAPTGLPFTMRITKGNTNANLGYAFEWRQPGCC